MKGNKLDIMKEIILKLMEFKMNIQYRNTKGNT